MRFLEVVKDGGPKSGVTAYVLIEIKCLFSIMLLRFGEDHREEYHSHAFNAFTVWLWGRCQEVERGTHDPSSTYWGAGDIKYTPREKFHKILPIGGDVWALTFRGPWVDRWKEWNPITDKETTLTHGRKEIHDA